MQLPSIPSFQIVAWQRTPNQNQHCSQECPASPMQSYLRFGNTQHSHCSPLLLLVAIEVPRNLGKTRFPLHVCTRRITDQGRDVIINKSQSLVRNTANPKTNKFNPGPLLPSLWQIRCAVSCKLGWVEYGISFVFFIPLEFYILFLISISFNRTKLKL